MPGNVFAASNMYVKGPLRATSCVTPAIPATGHVYDISIPDSFMYVYLAIGHVYDISIPDSFMYLTFLGMIPDSH